MARGEERHGGGALPVPIAMTAARPPVWRHLLPAAFLAHLLAARDGLDGRHRPAPAGQAAHSYRSGGQIAVRRLPPGYRTTRVV